MKGRTLALTVLALSGLRADLASGGDILGDVRSRLDEARRRLGELVGCGDNQAYGVSFATSPEARVPLSVIRSVPQRVVVLVHGLDDSGGVWRDAIRALLREGYAVARFEYPNDGPIAPAADLLAAELAALRAAGVMRIDVVAHSMGGLVARDVLTRPEHYAGDGTGGERLPALDRLVLVATPNHGAPLAAIHGLSELREHMTKSWSGKTSLFDWSEDGRGEAAEDLRPDSEFLCGLNARPLGSHTRYTIIAGAVSPVGQRQATELADAARRVAGDRNIPAWMGELLDDALTGAASGLRATAESIGDGVVSLDSALLPEVDDVVILEAGHARMIRGGSASDPDPPAIAVVLERLADDPIGGDAVSDDPACGTF